MEKENLLANSNAGSLLLLSKPVESIINMLEHILPYCDMISVRRGEILRYQRNKTRCCYLLVNGNLTLNRRGDGMILNSENAPFILGISNQFTHSENLYVRATEASELGCLPLERFNLLIEKHQLWQDLCRLLIYTASRVYEHSAIIAHMSSYDIVKYQLRQLMQEPEKVRSSVTASNYIKDRTYLSRSGIMKIVAQLRDAGYIVLQKGSLVDVRHLPEKY